MERNPYAPPEAVVSDVTSDAGGGPAAAAGPLYSVGQITLATFLGSILAGVWLMATNYQLLGQRQLAKRALWIGVGATAALIGLAFLLSDGALTRALPLATIFGMRAVAQQRFSVTLEKHAAAGGATASWWRAAGIGLVCLGIDYSVIVGLIWGYGLVMALNKAIYL